MLHNLSLCSHLWLATSFPCRQQLCKNSSYLNKPRDRDCQCSDASWANVACDRCFPTQARVADRREAVPHSEVQQGQVNVKVNSLSCPELVTLAFPMRYVSSPDLKHHTQRLRWRGACLPLIYLLRSIGTLVRLKHQLSLTSKARPARDSFKQPECNTRLLR